MGLIPSQDAYGRQPINLSLSLPPLLPLALKINKYILENILKYTAHVLEWPNSSPSNCPPPKIENYDIFVKRYNNCNSHTWLVEMQIGRATLEGSMSILYKIKHTQLTIQFLEIFP